MNKPFTSPRPRGRDLLLAVREAIIEEPRRLNMRLWRATKVVDASTLHEYHAEAPPCGTVGCIAGWAFTLAYAPSYQARKLRTSDVSEIATDLLTKSGYNYKAVYSLFRPWEWPIHLRGALMAETAGTEAYAAVVVRAIDLFLERPTEFGRAMTCS